MKSGMLVHDGAGTVGAHMLGIIADFSIAKLVCLIAGPGVLVGSFWFDRASFSEELRLSHKVGELGWFSIQSYL